MKYIYFIVNICKISSYRLLLLFIKNCLISLKNKIIGFGL